MSMRPRLHYHTDCDFFAGCESMIANFLNDERIRRDFEVSFSFRKSERYEAGFRNRVTGDVSGECYPILVSNVLSRLAANTPKLIRVVVRGASYLLLIRYWVFVWNVLVLYLAWRRRNFDLLHINNGNYPGALSCQSAAVAAHMAGVGSVVMMVNNIAISNPYWRRPFDFLLDYWVARSVTLFVTGSVSAGHALRTELKLPDDKVITLHNGILARQASETVSQTRARLLVGGGGLGFWCGCFAGVAQGTSSFIEGNSRVKGADPFRKDADFSD